ncbi:transcription factor Adf-1-like [Onthophagus taurus]|uniref:transcription factor Adf-1-like n=1 Tax=Onthophagus taurus TaxID=166361 RepID=UPI0039BE9A3D
MENVEKLVNLVQARPLLFDVRSVHYKNVFLRKKSWAEIAKIMGCTTEKCMQKWKTLRYKYFAEQKKTKLPSGSGKPFTKKWPFFKYLQYLDNYVGDSITKRSVHFDATNANDNESPSTMDYLSQEGSTAENPLPSGPIRNNFDEIVVEAPTPLLPLPT